MIARALLVGALAVGVLLPATPSASAADMPYSLEAFASAFLTDADIQALARWGVLIPDTPAGQECSVQAGGGYACTRVYPISAYGYSKPHVLSARTFTSPTGAQAALAEALAVNRARAVNVLAAAPSEFSIEWYPDPDHRVVTSGRLDRNHYVEASCAGRLQPGPPVADVNTCTQLMLNAQVPRLATFESPVIVPPGAPTGVLLSVKGSTASITWIPPESDGGAPITTYTATSTDGVLTCTAAPTAALVQGCSAPEARAGVAYTFTVTAANARGTSPVSAPSKPSRYTAKASVPQRATARVTGTSAAVSWRRPAELGGLKVLRYVVTATPGGQTCTSTATTCRIDGLSYSARYRFAVRAINGRGAGPAAVTAAVRTPAPPPPPPTPTIDPSPTPKPTVAFS